MPRLILTRHHPQKTLVDIIHERIVVTESGCWEWQGPVNEHGYARARIDGGPKKEYLHVTVYREIKGDFPDGLELDHLCHSPLTCNGGDSCRHRRCINPDHLEPVTHEVNIMRGVRTTAKIREWVTARKRNTTHCPKGHEYTPANTGISKRNQRWCKICAAAARKKYYDANAWRWSKYYGKGELPPKQQPANP